MPIRLCISSDLPHILKINQATFSRPYSSSFVQKKLDSYPQGCFIAKEDDDYVGYIIASLKNEKPYIVSLAVLSQWQGRGIAKQLLQHVFSQFIRDGYHTVFLHVKITNKQAIGFYERTGFEIKETIPVYYSTGEDAYIMEKNLSPQ